MKIKLTILGNPQGKGRPRFANINGKSIAMTPKETVYYENLIKTEYRNQIGFYKFPDGEPLDLRVLAYYSIPTSASLKKKALMASGDLRPTKKPDVDNIIKVVADSLNNIAYRDDAQIADAQVRKFYSTQPRLEIIIQPIKDLKGAL